MTQEEDLSICFANLKGAKEKDYIGTANALRRLKRQARFNSNPKLAKTLGVSPEIIREFLVLLKLPKEVQDLFGPDGLKLEQGRRLWQLARQRPGEVPDAADAMSSLTAHDSRSLVEYLLRHLEASVATAHREIVSSKGTVTKEFHVIAILNESSYKDLAEKATAKRIPVDQLVTEVVQTWLAGKGASSGQLH